MQQTLADVMARIEDFVPVLVSEGDTDDDDE